MQQNQSYDLAVVVPVYNPLPLWSVELVHQFRALLKALPGTSVHLSLVDDGTTNGQMDAEIEWLRKQIASMQLLRHANNKGKGAALRTGVHAAHATVYLITDVDFPFDTAGMVHMYQVLQQDLCDVAAGARNGHYYRAVPGMRALLSRLLRHFVKWRLRLSVDDTQCGLKGFNEKGKQIFLQTRISRYLFDIEFLMKASAVTAVRVSPVAVVPRNGFYMRNLSFKVMLQESFSFLRIMVMGNQL